MEAQHSDGTVLNICIELFIVNADKTKCIKFTLPNVPQADTEIKIDQDPPKTPITIDMVVIIFVQLDG